MMLFKLLVVGFMSLAHAFLVPTLSGLDTVQLLKLYDHSVVLFYSKACRSCSVVHPKYLKMADLVSDRAFFVMNIDGDRGSLEYAKLHGVVAIPCALIIDESQEQIVSCTPKEFERFRQSMYMNSSSTQEQ
jgi:hypothetical protein